MFRFPIFPLFDIPLSKDVVVAFESASEDPLLWLGRIPVSHIASTIEAMRREKRLLSGAQELLEKEQPLFHPVHGASLLDRYTSLTPLEASPPTREKSTKIIAVLLSQFSKAQVQIARELRLLRGGLTLDLGFGLPFLVRPSKKLKQLTALLPKVGTPSELPLSSLEQLSFQCPSFSFLSPSGSIDELSEALIDAIRIEEEKEEEATMNRYKEWCQQKASLTSLSERAPLLQHLEQELHSKRTEREDLINHLERSVHALGQTKEDGFISVQERLAERMVEKKRLNAQRERPSDYTPSVLHGTPFDPELTEEECHYLLSSIGMDSRESEERLKNDLSMVRESIMSLTKEINKIQVQCRILKNLSLF